MPRKDKSSLPASPAKSLVDELDLLKILLDQVGANYLNRLRGEIHTLRATLYNLALQPDTEISPAKARDLREMLILVRSLQTKPEKGRRKDLKRIDELIGDLENIVDQW
jgi:hypothetical protein